MIRSLSAIASLALAASAMPAQAAGADPAVPSALYSASLLQFINAYRSQHGLPTLDMAKNLTRLAQERAHDLAAHGEPVDARAAENPDGGAGCVENVGSNYPDAHAVFLGWQQSPALDEAMLDPAIHRGGIAVFGTYVTFIACN